MNHHPNTSRPLQQIISMQLAKTESLKRELEDALGVPYKELGKKLGQLPKLDPQSQKLVNQTVQKLLGETQPKPTRVSIPANRIRI